MAENSSSIRVAVRVRPGNERQDVSELATKHLEKYSGKSAFVKEKMRKQSLTYEQSQHLSCVGTEHTQIAINCGIDSRNFTYDYVAGPEASQQDMWDNVGLEVTQNVLEGFNGTIIAYGQTGSGKTHTVFGGHKDDSIDITNSEEKGIVPRAMQHIWEYIEQHRCGSIASSPAQELMCGSPLPTREGKMFTVTASMCEIYNERVYDLLELSSTEGAADTKDGAGRKSLQVRDDPQRGIFVEDLHEESLHSAEAAETLLRRGLENRHIACTAMNHASSRSHAVVMIRVDAIIDTAGTRTRRSSQFTLVDLAGSERQKRTKSQGETRLREAGQINRSLSELGNVIHALTSNSNSNSTNGSKDAGADSNQSRKYVQYRNSKLTMILRDSLGGNTRTALVATVTKDVHSLAESLITLKFAQRAKFIRNNPVVNELQLSEEALLRQGQHQVKVVQELQKEIATLKDRVRRYRAQGIKTPSRPPTPQTQAQAQTQQLEQDQDVMMMQMHGAMSSPVIRNRDININSGDGGAMRPMSASGFIAGTARLHEARSSCSSATRSSDFNRDRRHSAPPDADADADASANTSVSANAGDSGGVLGAIAAEGEACDEDGEDGDGGKSPARAAAAPAPESTEPECEDASGSESGSGGVSALLPASTGEERRLQAMCTELLAALHDEKAHCSTAQARAQHAEARVTQLEAEVDRAAIDSSKLRGEVHWLRDEIDGLYLHSEALLEGKDKLERRVQEGEGKLAAAEEEVLTVREALALAEGEAATARQQAQEQTQIAEARECAAGEAKVLRERETQQWQREREAMQARCEAAEGDASGLRAALEELKGEHLAQLLDIKQAAERGEQARRAQGEEVEVSLRAQLAKLTARVDILSAEQEESARREAAWLRRQREWEEDISKWESQRLAARNREEALVAENEALRCELTRHKVRSHEISAAAATAAAAIHSRRGAGAGAGGQITPGVNDDKENITPPGPGGSGTDRFRFFITETTKKTLGQGQVPRPRSLNTATGRGGLVDLHTPPHILAEFTAGASAGASAGARANTDLTQATAAAVSASEECSMGAAEVGRAIALEGPSKKSVHPWY